MSSSFVKDCSDVSTPGNSSSGKTIIVIVNNETGNVSLDQNELQNLLASHGADGSQVSVVRMGSGGVGGVIDNASEIASNPSIVATADGDAHINFTVEGYPAIPIEGQVNSGMNYAELPLDQDAFQRLESVLDSEEAREILGEPLLNMVANSEHLGTLDQFMDTSLFEGSVQEGVNDTGSVNSEGSSPGKKTRSPPKRRSQRQMDKAEREEVEKILAENQKLLKEEKQQLNEQLLEKMKIEEENKEEKEEEGEQEETEEASDETETGGEDTEQTKDSDASKKKARPPRGRGRGKGKVEPEKDKPQETKGRGKGKKKVEDEEQEQEVVVGRAAGRGRGKGSPKEGNVGAAVGRGKGKGSPKQENVGKPSGRGRGKSIPKEENVGKTTGKGRVILRRDKGEGESDVGTKTRTLKSSKNNDSESVKGDDVTKSKKENDKSSVAARRNSKKDARTSDENKSGDITDRSLAKENNDGSLAKENSDGSLAKENSEGSLANESSADTNTVKGNTKKGGKKTAKGSGSDNDKLGNQDEGSGGDENDRKVKEKKIPLKDADRESKDGGDNEEPPEGMDTSNNSSLNDTKFVDRLNEDQEDLQIKKVKVNVQKIRNIEEVMEKEMGEAMDVDNSSVTKSGEELVDKSSPEKGKPSSTIAQSIAELNTEIFGDSEEPERDPEPQTASSTPKAMSKFQPSVASTPLAVQLDKINTSGKALVLKGAKGQKFVLTKNVMSTGNTPGKVSLAPKLKIPGKSDIVVLKTKVQAKGPTEENPKTDTTKEKEDQPGKNVLPEKTNLGDGKSRLVQVNSPMGMRQVVVNSTKSPTKATLVKVIDPIAPPREEDRLTVAQICANAKKEAAQKRKLDLKKKKAEEDEDDFDADDKEKPPVQSKILKVKGKLNKTKVETPQKKEAPKIVDLEMKMEDSVQQKKREAQRKREEIQRQRDEVLKKREAIKLKKEQQKLEIVHTKRDDGFDLPDLDDKVDKTPLKMPTTPSLNKNVTGESLKKSNGTENPKKEIKVTVQSNKNIQRSNSSVKMQGLQRSDSVEVPSKSKEQGIKRSDSEEVLTKKGQKLNPKKKVTIDGDPYKGQAPNPKKTAAIIVNTKKEQIHNPKKVQTPNSKKTVTDEVMTNKGQTPNPKKVQKIALKEKIKIAVPKTPSTPKRSAKETKAVPKRVVVKKPEVVIVEDSPVRRSGRAIKKKSFGDEMVTFDLKGDIAPEEEEEEEEDSDIEEVPKESEPEENEESEGEDYDDPERLWCICQKPHNNRFMICCDRCEDWFHGSCVNISKKDGQKMEDQGQEWVCPKCKKAEKALRGVVMSPITLNKDTRRTAAAKAQEEEPPPTPKSKAVSKPESQKIVESSSKKEVQDVQPLSKKVASGAEVSLSTPGKSASKTNKEHSDDIVEVPSSSASSSKGASTEQKKDLEEHQIPGVSTTTLKSEPRVLVYEKSSGKILSGSDAPLLRDIKNWLKDHPGYGVLHPGMVKTPGGGAVVKTVKTDSATPDIDTTGQKKVIQLSGPQALSAIKPQKLTVMKAADGRIIVKAPEALNKEYIDKVVSSTTSNTPSTPNTISTTTSSTTGGPSKFKVMVKKTENKVSGIGGESLKSIQDDPDYSFSDDDELPDLGKITSTQSSSPVKKVGQSSNTVKKSAVSSIKKISVETSSSTKKNVADSTPIRKIDVETGSSVKKTTVDSTPAKRVTVESSNSVKKTPDSASSKGVDSKTSDVTSPINTEGFYGKNAEPTPSKCPSSPVKDPKKTPMKSPVSEKKPNDPSIVRGNVQKTLAECLTKRSKEAPNEFKDLTEEAISELAEEIEKELFLFFSRDVGFKYKSRYRSLLFNIRDTKNSGLYRKILNGTISPSKLSKMTSEELASKELAEWREREEKKELQAIEKYELDMISLGNQYIMKSHKGEIEIDKDDFIKDKEKAPETINTLPTEPVGLLEDTTLSHKNHMYDINCQICTGSLDVTILDKNRDKYLGKRDDKTDPAKIKDRKDRKSSSDKERRRHKSRDHDKDRSKRHKREKSKERDRDGKSKERDKKGSDKDKSKDKQRDRKDSERERHRSSSDKRERRDLKEDKDRKHKHKDRRSSKDDRERRRRDSDSKDRKRKHSESRSDDSKRREGDKSILRETDILHTELELDRLEREKAVVSTSDDVVVDLHRRRRESFSHLDAEAKDSVPTSTVIGSPDIMEIRDDGYPSSSYDIRSSGSPSLFPNSPHPSGYPAYIPPLPGDDLPPPPPLPESPPVPPPPESPATPPLPDSLLDSPKTPSLPDEICLSPSTADDDDFPNTPPLPDDDDDDIPATPPLPSDMDGEDRPSTPPLPTKGQLSKRFNSIEDKDRLTPPLGGVLGTLSGSSPSSLKSTEQIIVWKGAIHMTDVSKFAASAFEVSGKSRFLPEDVPNTIEVVGRISPDTVWSYIAQTKKTGSKEILVIRFQPSNEEEKVSYIALYSYLSSKKRYGVIGNCEKAVKDFYIVPLASHQPIPQVLLPLDGPGFEEHRAHMLIGVIVRAKNRRIYDHITGTWQIIGGSSRSTVQKPSAETSERSYTPPLRLDPEVEEIALDSSDEDGDNDISLTPPLKKNDEIGSSPEIIESTSSLKRPSKEDSEFEQPKKRQSLSRRLEELAGKLPTGVGNSAAQSNVTEASLDQESMLAELNRQIEVHKKELSEMQKTVLNEEEEPYSPSMANAGASLDEETLKLDTSKINIPSNLQEILNNINEKEMEIKNKEMEIKRRLNLAADPIVMNYSQVHDSDSQPDSPQKSDHPVDTDLRSVLPQTKPKVIGEHKEDVDLRILQGRKPNDKTSNEDVFSNRDDTDLRVRDPRLARAHAAAVMEAIKKGQTLGTLSDEELLAKALEMERESKENENRLHTSRRDRRDAEYPPVPPPPFMGPGPSGFIPPQGPGVPPNAMPIPPQHPDMVRMPYMNQVEQQPQSMNMYGRLEGRDQSGPSGMHMPPQDMIPPLMGTPIEMSDRRDSQGYRNSRRYPDDGTWDRRYSEGEWEEYKYNQNHNSDHYRGNNRYRDDERNRDSDRDREWHHRQSHDKGYDRHPYRNQKSYGRDDYNRKSGSGSYERRRSSDGGGGGGKNQHGGWQKKNKWKKGDRNRDKKGKGNGRNRGQTREGDRNWDMARDDNDDSRGPKGDGDDDDCPYEIDY